MSRQCESGHDKLCGAFSRVESMVSELCPNNARKWAMSCNVPDICRRVLSILMPKAYGRMSEDRLLIVFEPFGSVLVEFEAFMITMALHSTLMAGVGAGTTVASRAQGYSAAALQQRSCRGRSCR